MSFQLLRVFVLILSVTVHACKSEENLQVSPLSFCSLVLEIKHRQSGLAGCAFSHGATPPGPIWAYFQWLSWSCVHIQRKSRIPQFWLLAPLSSRTGLTRGWRDGSALKSTYCSCKYLGLVPSSQPSLTPVPGRLKLTFGFHSHQAHVYVVHESKST